MLTPLSKPPAKLDDTLCWHLESLRKLSLRLLLAAANVVACAQASIADGSAVTVTLTGQVMPACSISNPNPLVDFGELEPVGAASVSFLLSCNTDFRVSLTSQNGGLSQAARQAASPPFIELIPYSVSVKLSGENVFIIDMCSSGHMTGALPACTGAGKVSVPVSGQNTTLGFSWNLHGSVPLAGSYRDVLTLTVNAGL
jgi:spore coat protein U-like protein